MKKSFAVLGGDQRQVRLAELLKDDKQEVMTCGLEKGSAPCSVSVEHALKADILVLPLPVCRDGALNLPLSETEMNVRDIFQCITTEKLVVGGMTKSIPASVREAYPLEVIDYYDREEVQVANAIPTAEGAIMRAMMETETTLHGLNCLVVGYGRIGKLLAHHLHALGVNVSVSARKLSDLAWIEACGYHPLHTLRLKGALGIFDLIFNTVPSTVFTDDLLGEVRGDCLLMELASAPGGFDARSVKENNLRYIEERGLPGKNAPISAAQSVRDAIYHILQERGIEL